jgi:predicted aspartyl protease
MAISNIPLLLEEIEPGNFHVFLDARAGRHKVRLLVDTGASRTAFDLQRFERLASKKDSLADPIHSVGLGSNQVSTHLHELSSLNLGELKLKQFPVAVLDLGHVNQAYQMLGLVPIDGVLGSDVMVKHKAIIDLGKKQLKLK